MRLIVVTCELHVALALRWDRGFADVALCVVS
jgi:hypothetical protein